MRTDLEKGHRTVEFGEKLRNLSEATSVLTLGRHFGLHGRKILDSSAQAPVVQISRASRAEKNCLAA